MEAHSGSTLSLSFLFSPQQSFVLVFQLHKAMKKRREGLGRDVSFMTFSIHLFSLLLFHSTEIKVEKNGTVMFLDNR